MASSNDVQQQHMDDIQQGRLIQSVETLVTNVGKLFDFANQNAQRLTALEAKATPLAELAGREMKEVRERIKSLEDKKGEVTKDDLKDVSDRLLVLETRRVTMGEVVTGVLALAAIAVAYFHK